MQFSTSIDASALVSFAQGFRQVLSEGMANQHLLRGFENAQATYLGQMREDFKMNSRGGGQWPDIAPSTKLKRYYAAGGRFKRTKGVTRMDRLKQLAALPFPILYITGELYTSLYPGSSGNIFQHSEDSVSAGTEIHHANIHQTGGKRIPQRRILTEPTQDLLERMALPIVAGFRVIIQELTGVSLSAGGQIAA